MVVGPKARSPNPDEERKFLREAVDSVNSVDNRTLGCEHFRKVTALWLRNDPTEGPPMLLLEGNGLPLIITMSNKTVLLHCPVCYRSRLAKIETIPL